MSAETIRSSGDIKLYESLLKNSDVIRVRKEIERLEEKNTRSGLRRHLLATITCRTKRHRRWPGISPGESGAFLPPVALC